MLGETSTQTAESVCIQTAGNKKRMQKAVRLNAYNIIYNRNNNKFKECEKKNVHTAPLDRKLYVP